MQICEIIRRGKFAVTCEIDSPKGTSLEEFFDKVDIVKEYVDAINIGDNRRAVMRAAPLAICHLLREKGIETIMEVAAQYRNRLALQADLLGAAILDIENLLITRGLAPSIGDHAEAESVRDIDLQTLLKAAVNLIKGTDLAGHALNEAPHFCLGVDVTLATEAGEVHLDELKEILSSGADYIQTQPIYEPAILERFLESIRGFNLPLIVGHMMLKSASMARFINSNLPGVRVPETLIRELEGLPRDQIVKKSLQISGTLLRKIKPLCQGVNFIPAGWEKYLPGIMGEIV